MSSGEVRKVRRSSTYRRRRRQVVDVYGTDCWICRSPIDMGAVDPNPLAFSIDHVVEIADGGSMLDLDNLRPAHIGCNRAKGQLKRAQRQGQPTPAWDSGIAKNGTEERGGERVG